MISEFKDYTPLPAKYTPSSLCKNIDILWQRFVTNILNNNKLTIQEKNEKINEGLKLCKMVHDYTMSGEMTYKKK